MLSFEGAATTTSFEEKQLPTEQHATNLYATPLYLACCACT